MLGGPDTVTEVVDTALRYACEEDSILESALKDSSLERISDSVVLLTTTPQLSFEVDPVRIPLAVPTRVPMRNAIWTAAKANGISSLKDLAEAIAEAASKPVPSPTARNAVPAGYCDEVFSI